MSKVQLLGTKIALVGPKYLVNPLSACGIDVAACETEKHGSEILKDLVLRGEHRIIFIIERLAVELKEEIEAAEKKDINIVLVPDHRGSVGLFREILEGLIKKATGALKA